MWHPGYSSIFNFLCLLDATIKNCKYMWKNVVFDEDVFKNGEKPFFRIISMVSHYIIP